MSHKVARHFLPGGREHGGGIGRLVGYIVDEAERHGGAHAITDTRGPGFRRSSPRSGSRSRSPSSRATASWIRPASSTSMSRGGAARCASWC